MDYPEMMADSGRQKAKKTTGKPAFISGRFFMGSIGQ